MSRGKLIIAALSIAVFLLAVTVLISIGMHSPRAIFTAISPADTDNEEISLDDFIPKSTASEHIVEYPLDIYKLSLESSKTFYRDHLDEHARAIYDDMKPKLQKFAEEIEIPQDAPRDEVKSVLTAIAYDNPGMFWFSPSGTIIRYEQPVFCPDYTMSKEDALEAEKQIAAILDQTAAAIAAQAPNDHDRQRQLVVSWIADHCSYDDTAENGRNIVGAVLNGKAYCAGYARSEIALLRLLGIPCIYIEGMAATSEGDILHAWVLVVEKQQLTWDDPTWYDSDAEQPADYNDEWLASTWYDFADTHRALDASDIVEKDS